MEKIYRVQMNSKGMPNFATAVEVVDRPQREWIKTDRTYCGATVYKCPVCGADIDEMPTVMGVPKYKFCPSCGAQMKGADDE